MNTVNLEVWHMYNDHEEQYEVDDFDEDIKRRKELLEEAKQLQEAENWNEVFKDVLALRKKWKQIHYWESAYEDELEEEFDGYLDTFYAKRNEGYQSNQALKEELIAQAKKLSISEEWNRATEEMNELMAQWKASGSAGKDHDESLWQSFNEARQIFFDRKHEHWKELQSKFKNAGQAKQELIAKAAALCDSEEWQKTSEAFRVLMEEWKAAGSAGRDQEDSLWNQFNEHRQKFYDRRSKYYDEVREQQNQKYEEKKALVEQAKKIVERKEFTKELTAQMKQLGVDWKKIGACGKEKEDEIWKEFRLTMDAYFNGMKEFNDQKHLQWKQRMIEIRNRKQDMIQNQKRQIKYLEQEIVGLIGERAILETEEEIEEKKEFIKQLEAELADIEKKLAE